MGNFYMEATQINYRRDETLKTVDQKLQELSQESAIDTDIAPVFKSTSTYNPGDLVYYRNKLYKCTNQHTGAWAAGDFTATDVSTALNTAAGTLNDIKADYVDIAPPFDSTASYTAGDLVEYQGIIYRCTNDHTGDWDADDFSATTIAAEIHEVNSILTSVEEWVDADAKTVTGNPITITDAANLNAKAMSMSIEPIQDLHGYDKPWVGGAGKNKFNLSISTQTVSDVAITVNDDGTFYTSGTASADIGIILGVSDAVAGTRYKLNGCPAGGSVNTYKLVACDDNTGEWYSDTGDGADNIDGNQVKKVKLVIASGTNVSGLCFKPMVYLNSETDATFAPYTNICPISGLTSGVVERVGSNSIGYIESGTIGTDGTKSQSQSNRCRTSNMLHLLSGEKYVINGTTSENGKIVQVSYQYWETDTFGNNTRLYNSTWATLPLDISPTVDCWFTVIFRYSADSSINPSNLDIRFGSESKAIITFNDTVYGGSVDFKTGKVRVTHALVDLSTLSWGKANIDNNKWEFVATQSGMKIVGSGTRPNAFCSIYQIRTRASEYSGNMGLALNPSYNQICVCDTNYSTSQEFSDSLDSNCVLCYELATPTELTLTPAELELLKGNNTLTANGATISLTYQPDNLVGEVMEQVEAEVDGAKAYTDAKVAAVLPTYPTTDGAYVLTATVSSGETVLSWESAT